MKLLTTVSGAGSHSARPLAARALPQEGVRARPAPFQLSLNASFYLLASIVLGFLAGSSAPTPLYGMYQAAWGFSSMTVTVVFGVYAVAVLASLLTLGSLSDYVGRRPVLLSALLLQAITMLIFANARGLGDLLAARVIQGLSTGAAVGAVGAGMLDIDRTRGTMANAVGPMLGTGLGGLVSGLMVQYLPLPTELVYLSLFALFLAQAVGVVLMPESVIARPGALASLRPRLSIPETLRGPLLFVVPVTVAAWALAGFYGSLAPTLLRHLLGSSSALLGGLAVSVLASGGVATTLLLRDWKAKGLLIVGSSSLLLGVSLTLLAVQQGSALGFFIGSVVTGAGFGAGFQGAIRTIVTVARPEQRATALSLLYIVAYLAMGLPAIGAGFLVVHGGGLLLTVYQYGASVLLLAATALLAVGFQSWRARRVVA